MMLKTAPSGDQNALRSRIAGPAGLPVVVSIPHTGRWLTAEVAAEARVSPAVLARLGDGWADIIGAPLVAAGASLVIARLARAVADCNRHEGDMDPADVESALRPRFGPPGRKARAGLGVVPTRLPGIGSLWQRPVDAAGLEARLEALHRPYHQALSKALATVQRQHGAVLLIDLHSMPPLPASRGDPHPATIVIGDRFGRSASPLLAALTRGTMTPGGARVAINQPYAGGHIIERHGAPQKGVHALQVEFDRRLYLDADGLPDAARALVLGDWLLGMALRWVDELVDQRAAPLAAE